MWAAVLAVTAAALLRRAPEASVEDDFGLDAATWEGWDEESVEAARPPLAYSANATNTTLWSNVVGNKFQVMGLFNTGTNLMYKLLEKNFGGVPSTGAGSAAFWKHTKPSALIKARPYFKTQLRNSGVTGVAVIRDPMSWLQSMRKAPYDLKNCFTSYNWVSAPCTLPAPCNPPSTNCVHPAHQGPMHFPNVEAFWNEWTKDYDALGNFGFSSFVVVRYEDIVLDTQGVLARVAKAGNLPAPNTVVQQHASAKNHGSSSGRAAALEKLRTKSYLHSYTPTTRHAACDRLDRPLMHKHDYSDCDGY